MPKALWWIVAPFCWLWQYLVYVPAYVVTNLLFAVIHLVAAYPERPFSDRRKVNFDLRPWFLDHLR